MASSALLEDLSVPYTLMMSAVERDGTWLRRAEYRELPGCVVEALTALEAVHRVDVLRVRLIVEMRRRGEAAPRPRPPLDSPLALYNLDELLVEIFDEALGDEALGAAHREGLVP
jgi:hypothetical protein